MLTCSVTKNQSVCSWSKANNRQRSSWVEIKWVQTYKLHQNALRDKKKSRRDMKYREVSKNRRDSTSATIDGFGRMMRWTNKHCLDHQMDLHNISTFWTLRISVQKSYSGSKSDLCSIILTCATVTISGCIVLKWCHSSFSFDSLRKYHGIVVVEYTLGKCVTINPPKIWF